MRSPRSGAGSTAGARAPEGRAGPERPPRPLVVPPPVRPDVPGGVSAANPIDAFLGVEHRGIGLTPRPRADKAELLRRVTLDLTGLAPSREELRAFLADDSPDAYEKAVDRLLASPQFGERWGRHWMDVWRYSDWDGFDAEIRESRPFIWHWRDWIVESLNRDLGYDRMIVLMLAADEAAPDDDSALRATGFLARNWDKFSRSPLARQRRRAHGQGVPRPDDRLRPLPRPQVRPDLAGRLLPLPRHLRAARGPGGPPARSARTPAATACPAPTTPSRTSRPTSSSAATTAGRISRRRSRRAAPNSSPGRRVPAGPVARPRRRSRCPMLRGRRQGRPRGPRRRRPSRTPGEGARQGLARRSSGCRGGGCSSRRPRERALAARIQADEARLSEPARPEAKPLALRAKRAEAELAAREGGTPPDEGPVAALAIARKAARPGDAAAKGPSPPPRTELAAAGEGRLPRRSRRRTTTGRPTTRPLGPIYPAESTGRRLALATLDRLAREPADGPRGRQPRLGAALRPPAGRQHVRLRAQRPAAHASRPARLARDRVRRPRAGA